MLDHLRHQSAVISLEAASGENAVMQAVQRLPTFFTAAKVAFQKLLNVGPIPNGVMLGAFRKRNPADYAQMRHLIVAIPPGMSVDYLTYVNTLHEVAKLAIHLRSNVIAPFSAWAGERLGNPASLAAISSNLNITGYKPLAVDKLQQQLDKCFTANARHEATATYAKVIQRNADWTEVNQRTAQINELFAATEHNAIMRSVNDLVEILDQLGMRVEQSREVYKLSPAALNTLSVTTLAVAQQLEFYGALRYRLVELNKALQDADENLRGYQF